ncbi:dephospho-CoA kinase [Microbacterium sp. TNHR37B]|uniref:dephospho-CoA kinase n=1 Tax=Microbacterium sp. TNHR37B TaxID=1775956 RepID=UPI0007B25C91|nr:dephospho-CoA kinase [Microbacterium sp. TNHR37B]KZE90725.1 Dephospho-CoA kinase [Microbacterium sp. TNHR37B]
MALIALTGGIASGKSTIAHRLRSHGAVVVDADAVVRDVQRAGSPVLEQIRDAFGDGVVGLDGALDRAALAGIVFTDDAARERLNAIVHPAVRAESARRFEEAFAHDPDAIVVYDVPLLVEARADEPWDLVVLAHAPAGVRRERLVSLRGMTDEEARARVAAQTSDAQRLAIADVVIDTAGSLEETLAQTDALWRRLRGQPGPS